MPQEIDNVIYFTQAEVTERERKVRIEEHLESCQTCIDFKGEAVDYDCHRLAELRAAKREKEKE